MSQKENKRDTGRRSRKKGKNSGSPNYPISPSMLTSSVSVRLEPGQQEVLNFSLAESNTVPLYHVSPLGSLDSFFCFELQSLRSAKPEHRG